MKKSQEFDNVLDECLERLLVKGEALEQCLGSYPEHADELKPLLETALAAKKASAIQPRLESRDKARHQLYSALHDMELKKSRPFFSWRWQPQWAMVVAIILVIVLAGGGTVVAASGSMPDEPLYPVKLATERVWVVLTPSTLGKAELYAKLADRRVLEIVRMAGKSKPEKIELTAQRLDTYLTRIADLASVQSVVSSGGEAVTPAVPAVKEAMVAEKAVPLEESLATEESLPVERAPSVSATPLMPERAGGGKEPPIKLERRAKLRVVVVHYAVNHPARLRALLETVPPSARPALLRAIAISENGYKKALESLD